MGARGARNGRLGARRGVVRGAAVLLLALGGLLALGLTPALGAAPAPPPVPVPTGPYGGQLEAPEPGTTFDDEQVLEVGMLALGSLNGLAFAGVVIASRFRGASAQETRHALMNRTDPGVPSGPRRRPNRRRSTVAAGTVSVEPVEPAFRPLPPLPPVPHQGGPGVPGPRPPAAPALRPVAPRR